MSSNRYSIYDTDLFAVIGDLFSGYFKQKQTFHSVSKEKFVLYLSFFWLCLLWSDFAHSQHQACATPAKGMVCIAGGKLSRADAKQQPFQIQLATYYLDVTDVTNREYTACVKAGGCFRRHDFKAKQNFMHPAQPVTEVDWYDAMRYCHWVGKRLPTETELEWAAQPTSGGDYAWGATPPSCKNAHFAACKPRKPLFVHSGKPSQHGLFHISGNVSKWAYDWYAPCFDGCKLACGQDCKTDNALGPCTGKSHCPERSMRVIRGGNWKTTARALHNKWRGGLAPTTRSTDLGFRCASSTAQPQMPGEFLHLQTRPDLPDPKGPLSPELHDIFWQTPVDQIDQKEICPKPGRSYIHCRDPNNYVRSNEPQQWLWRQSLLNLGGIHIGIGSDQNYNLIAWARSRLAWIMDYDNIVVGIHKVYRGFFLQASNPQEFVAAFEAKNAKASLKYLDQLYAKDHQRKLIATIYSRYRERLRHSFVRDLSRYAKDPQHKHLLHYWLADPKNYGYIRLLYQQNRIRIMPGDLLQHNSLAGVAKASHKLNSFIRTVYLSNAEENWLFPGQFRKSFDYMNFDQMSVIVRTSSQGRWGTKAYGYWHYNLHGAFHYRQKISEQITSTRTRFRYIGLRKLMHNFRVNSPIHVQLTFIGMPRTSQPPAPYPYP